MVSHSLKSDHRAHGSPVIKAAALHFPLPPLSDSKSKHHYLCRNLHLISSLAALLIPLVQTERPKLPDGWMNGWSGRRTVQTAMLVKKIKGIGQILLCNQ